jgi:nucleotide-binding universal stress UspA family protein/rubrerythrin
MPKGWWADSKVIQRGKQIYAAKLKNMPTDAEGYMYKKIYIPVDNSEHSNAAIEMAVALARAFGATLVGSHVYAARLHDYRFRQMEYTLPPEYQHEEELEKQRRIHDSLITMGLQLISDSYLEVLAQKAQAAGLTWRKVMLDGKNYAEMVRDIRQSDYDLVVMGALGMGAVKHSSLGSVCERVVRRIRTDTLVVKNTLPPEAIPEAPIVVAIDGSLQSYAGLSAALALGKACGRPVEAVGVYDPFLHYAVFHSLSDVLTPRAAKVFRFKEQEQLHEEVIDTGLAKIYQSHLEVARAVARDQGTDLKTTLLDGKPFDRILRHVRQREAWLLVLGRIGVHGDEELDIGSNTENLLRLVPCHVLITSRKFYPPLDVKAEAAIAWTAEAEARMEKVPGFVKAMARTAVLRFAMEWGHSVITSSVIEQVMDLFMPRRTAEKARELALGLAVERIRSSDIPAYICRSCGHTARGVAPAMCVVCGAHAASFERLDKATVEALAATEGAIREEEAFDGLKLRWTEEANRVLRMAPSGYMRRRAKARIEKAARVQHLEVIGKELAWPIVAETLEDELTMQDRDSLTPEQHMLRATRATGRTDDLFTWTDEATARLHRVPEGYMRDTTKQRVEEVAAERATREITLEIVEAGIEVGKKMMAELLQKYNG